MPALRAAVADFRRLCDAIDAMPDPVVAQGELEKLLARVARFEREVPLEVKREVLG